MPGGLSTSDFYYILPELVITGGALLVLIADVLLPRRSKALGWITLLVIGATLASLAPFTSTHVEVAHGLLARRLDDDIGPELQERLQRFDDRHLAPDLLLRRLGAARAHQDADDVDVGLLVAKDVEQRLADGAIADQCDFETLFPGHALPPRNPRAPHYSGRVRALRLRGAAVITPPPASGDSAFLTECSSAW